MSSNDIEMSRKYIHFMVHALPTMATPPFSHYLHREFWAKKSLILRVGDIGWFLSYFFIIILPRHGRTIYSYTVNVKARKCIISLYWFGDKKNFSKLAFMKLKF